MSLTQAEIDEMEAVKAKYEGKHLAWLVLEHTTLNTEVAGKISKKGRKDGKFHENKEPLLEDKER